MKDLKEKIIEAVQDATNTVDGTVSIPILDHFLDGILSEQLRQPPDAKHLLSAVASIEQIEEVARKYFEVKYPLMDLTIDEDKCEIDWWDMLQFVQHVLSCHCRSDMTRLLIQFESENPFGGELHEKGVFNTFNEAVEAAILLIDDNTIKVILVNHGSQWVRIKW